MQWALVVFGFSICRNNNIYYYYNDIDNIKWNTNPISKDVILAKQQELQAEYESNQYQRDRAKEYPTFADQLDLIYWDKVNGTNNWQEAINAVKTKYPKE